MVEFQQVAKADLPIIKEIYDYYILNSTATFHSVPITIPGLREILFIDNPKYPSFTIRKDGKIIGYCFLTRYKNRQAYDRTAELSIYLRTGVHGKRDRPAALKRLEEAAGRSGIRVLIGTLCGENYPSIPPDGEGGVYPGGTPEECWREVRHRARCRTVPERDLTAEKPVGRAALS